MIANITVSSLHTDTIHVQGKQDFSVTYINTTDGKSFTAYQNTPGFNLLKEGGSFTIHYKTNIKNGKMYNNCFGIVLLKEPIPVANQMLDTLNNIKELLETLVQSQQSKSIQPTTTIPPTIPSTQEEGLPF